MLLKKSIVSSLLVIQCLFMNNKKTLYYDMSIAEIEQIKKLGYKPTLGIHVCCGVCASFPLEFLAPIFNVKVLYFNPNIYPKNEYDRRLNELKRYILAFNDRYNENVELIEFEYNNEEFMKDLSEFSLEKEGGKRCLLCYEKRMDLTYKYSNDNNYDYFTTVMTISRQKNSYILNQIGERLSKKYHCKYFYSDFKKKKGIDRVIELKKEYDMYSQLYCGCIYSYQDYLNKIKNEEK